MKQIWSETYRPNTIDGYVFKDAKQKKQVQSWIASGALPHLLFSGIQGIGKTTLAKLLLHELGAEAGDILEINASVTNGVDEVRDRVVNFASTMGFSEFKYIILDEADYLSQNAQAALRGVMQTYATSTRFILTCNYPNKIIPAIHSRCQGFHLAKLDRTEYTARMAEILIREDVKFDLNVLDSFVSVSYPDMRKCINLCQMNSTEGELKLPDDEAEGTADYKLEMVALFKEGRYADARKLICSQVGQEEYDDMYRFLYENLHFWGDDEAKQNEAILVIKKGLVDHGLIADPEICLSATLINLEGIANGD